MLDIAYLLRYGLAVMPKNPKIQPNRRLVEIVAFQDVQVLDVTGPLQVLESANAWAKRKNIAPPYKTRVVSRASPVRSWAGLSFITEPLPPLTEPVDTLIIAGGAGVRSAVEDEVLIAWIKRRSAKARRVASVCTGAFLLGRCGLLDGVRVTTHWDACDQLAQLFPKALVESDPIFIEHGNVWTSAGVTAGIDMTLALVERDLGHSAAMYIARGLVIFLRRPGGQSQFSSVLSLQTGDDRFDQLHSWAADNLRKDMSIAALARKVGMSERSFTRHYRKLVGKTPARAIEAIRVEAARDLLSTTNLPIKLIAERCGFGTEDTMRRSFLRAISVPPQDYRRRFQNRKS